MDRKYIALFIAAIFFLGISSLGLCLSFGSIIASNCCAGKPSPVSSDTENCFFHCTKRKTAAIETEGNFVDNLKIKIPFLRVNKSSIDPQDFSPNSNLTPSYLNERIIELNIRQIYFLAIFNHAPPLLLN